MVELLALLLTALVFAVPGIVFSFALFSGTRFNKLDKAFGGAVMGLIIVPLLAFFENFFLGLSFSAMLLWANTVLFLLVGLWLAFGRGLLSFEKLWGAIAAQGKAFEKRPVLVIIPILLISIFFVGLHFRVAYSHSSNFFEFDPYYYSFVSEMLVTKGHIPLFTDLSYFPLEKFHHEPPLAIYITGAWNVVYNFFAGISYDKDSLILINNLYPPVVGALLSVVVYWLLRAHYHEVAGIAGAALFASTPLLLQKFAAGVAELQPWGIFAALLMFAFYMLYLEYKQWQFIAMAGLATVASILGAAQYVWPLGVMSAFFFIQAFVNYYAKHDDWNFVFAAIVFAASSLLSMLVLNVYTGTAFLSLPQAVLVALVSSVPAVFLFFAAASPQLGVHSRKKVIGVLLVLGLALSLVPLPGGSLSTRTATFVSGVGALAEAGSPLAKTIAEEARTGSGENPGAFGILSPFMLLLLALFFAWGAIEQLLITKRYRAAGVFVAGVLGVVLLRSEVSNFAITFGSTVGLALVEAGGKLLAANELFAYLLISVVSAVVAFIYAKEEQRAESGLLISFVVFPVAYIGLNKAKFLIHLSAALAIGAATLLGEVVRRAAFIHEYFKVGKTQATALRWTLGFAVVLALLITSVQAFGFPGKAPGVVNSVSVLGFSKISNDWLLAMQWLRNNTNYNSPELQARCRQAHSHDCRVMSWWDYGHWTVFLGETKTVLDPGNSYPNFNQEVAYGFVDNQSAFLKSMEYHEASHVLVDFQLIEKWGALVFLSGTCQRQRPGSGESITCPEASNIADWKQGSGGSLYELEHYFESLDVQGECPFAPGMLLLQSNFGIAYCASQTDIVPVDNNGLRTDLSRPYKVIDLRSRTEEIDQGTHYLIPLSQSSFVDANPDLRVGGRENRVINSTFARLYVFENLPGFELRYRSPNGEVKIFEKVS